MVIVSDNLLPFGRGIREPLYEDRGIAFYGVRFRHDANGVDFDGAKHSSIRSHKKRESSATIG